MEPAGPIVCFAIIKEQHISNEERRGPLGDARPDGNASRDITPSLPQEKPEDRDNVSIVTPEDYPLADREISNVANTGKHQKAKQI
jgi:hypothetical protein